MDDDDLSLSAGTLAALQEFMREKDARQKRFEELKAQAEDESQKRTTSNTTEDRNTKEDNEAVGGGEGEGEVGAVTMQDFEADWNASQFWYDEETSRVLAEELVRGATRETRVALVSAPSVFVKLRELMKNGSVPECNIQLFEFDNRFALFGGQFTFYDFNEPLKLPGRFKGVFDRVLVDPPFLSEDCQTKAALTVRWLSKPWNAPSNGNLSDQSDVNTSAVRIIVCTGERMKDTIDRMYKKAGVKCTGFEIRHAQGLSNEFRCYSSFESEVLKFV